MSAGAFGDFFEHLPITLELILTSALIALILAAVCSLLSRPATAWLAGAVAGVLFMFMCVPVFWLACIGQYVVVAVYGTFNLSDRFTHLLLPATLLALVQAGAYVDSIRSGFSARLLLATFASLLPAILSADVLVEIFFAWP